jgi:hypothetical protein
MRSMRLPEVALIFVWGLFWVFGWAGMWMGLGYLRNRSRDRRLEMMHKERMAAMEKGILLPELPDLDVYSRRSRERDPDSALKGGILCAAVGLGAMLAFYLSADPDLHEVWSLPCRWSSWALGLCCTIFFEPIPSQAKTESTEPYCATIACHTRLRSISIW